MNSEAIGGSRCKASQRGGHFHWCPTGRDFTFSPDRGAGESFRFEAFLRGVFEAIGGIEMAGVDLSLQLGFRFGDPGKGWFFDFRLAFSWRTEGKRVPHCTWKGGDEQVAMAERVQLSVGAAFPIVN